MLTIFLHEKNLQARLFSADFMQIELMILCVYEQHVIMLSSGVTNTFSVTTEF